jgi:glycosyltransferase involved in cell wall biosynthesis
MLQVSSAHVYLTYPFVLSWSLLDAMATECEIVASDTAPVREVIEDRKNGVLVPFHDSSVLSQVVVGVLANRRPSSKHGAAARKTVAERFDKGVCVQEALRAMGVDGPNRLAAVAA